MIKYRYIRWIESNTEITLEYFFCFNMINLHINCVQEWNAVISLYQHTMPYKLLIRKWMLDRNWIHFIFVIQRMNKIFSHDVAKSRNHYTTKAHNILSIINTCSLFKTYCFIIFRYTLLHSFFFKNIKNFCAWYRKYTIIIWLRIML